MTHYERALEIQQRLESVLDLVAAGQHSTPQIADELNVSTASVSRCIEALREDGYTIEALKRDGQWRYQLHERGENQSVGLAKAGKSLTQNYLAFARKHVALHKRRRLERDTFAG